MGGSGHRANSASVSLSVVIEIQELDSNMQYLVYENHSKFIKASETIREVCCLCPIPLLGW